MRLFTGSPKKGNKGSRLNAKEVRRGRKAKRKSKS